MPKRKKAVNNHPSPLDGQIGQRIKARRIEKGLSQEEIAKVVGVSTQQVQKYEYGTNSMRPSRLLKLCAALEVTPHWLLGFKE